MTATSSVTVRLSAAHLDWLRSDGRSITEGVREAVERAMREDSYRRAQKVLERIPLDQEDDWGDLESFMIGVRPHEG